MWRTNIAQLGPQWRLDDKRIAYLAMVALFGLLVVNAVLLAQVAGGRGASDLFVFWSSARFVQTLPPSQIYDQTTLHLFQTRLGMQADMPMPFLYPPGILLLIWPLGLFSLTMAFGLWVGLSFAAYLVSLLSRDGWQMTALAALAAPSSAICVALGQTGFLIAGLLVGGLRMAPRRPVLGGVLLGLAAVKPQFALLVPVALVAAGSWRCLSAAATTGLAIAALSSAAFGWSIWLAWAEALPQLASTIEGLRGALEWRMPTVTGNLDRLGINSSTVLGCQIAAATFAGLRVWFAFRRGPRRAAIAALLAGSFLATPYALPGDLPLLTGATILLVQERARGDGCLSAPEIAMLGMAFIMAIVPFPLSAAVPLLLFALSVAHAGPASRRWRSPQPAR